MTVQYSDYVVDRYIAPGVSTFDRAEIPDLRSQYDQHSFWLSNHFLNSALSGAFTAPMRQYTFNAIYRVQTAFSEYHQARELTYHCLEVRAPGTPAIRAYFAATSRWESCFLNWQILADIFRRMTNTDVYEKGDGSPDQRAYDIANAIKHCGQAIRQGEHGADLTVPLWLMNDGFHSRNLFVSYDEFADLFAQAARLADELQDPRTFVQKYSGS